jgi:anti-sigma B factor antagonist
MEIREHHDGQVAVLSLSGRFTMADLPGLVKDAVTRALDAGAKHIVLDLSDVRYIDSTRLGELIASHVTVSRRGGRFTLAGTPERIVELLTVAGLDGVFERFPTVEDAKRRLAAHAV